MCAMMARKDYHYPDRKDEMTTENIKRIELYPGYWEESEMYILNIVKDLINTNARHERFLDAGCGEGRLVLIFERQFDEIVAIDPDQERLKVAADLICDSGLAKKATLKRSAIEEFENDKKFDFVLCSHVLQHVHTDAVPIIIKNLKKLMNNDGILCITTCHSTKENGYFVKNTFKYSQHSVETITKDEFNSLINSGGVLPVRFFKLEELSSLLKANGFKIIEFKVFHIETRIFGEINGNDLDGLANSSFDLQKKNGWDMMIAAMPIQ